MIGEADIAADYRRRHTELRALANRYYWNAELGTYCDILADDPQQQVPVKTPAAYWGLLAGFCDEQQTAAMARLAEDPQRGFGGDIPWPSVTRDDPAFRDDGEYWRGGVWLPMVYMATCALRENGFAPLADQLAERVLTHMVRTWQEFEPATIWEAYSPTRPSPCSDKVEFAGQLARPDFCGWSALGPISLFIESVLGFHKADAISRELHWNRHRSTPHGIRRLRFGDILTDVWFDGTHTHVSSNTPYTLFINNQPHPVAAATQLL
jgi:glycogen debranching enzyme